MGLTPWPVPSPAPTCPASWRGSSLEAETGLGGSTPEDAQGLAVHPAPKRHWRLRGGHAHSVVGENSRDGVVGVVGKCRWTQDKGRQDVASELPTQAPEQAAEEACGGVPPPCQVPPEGSECVCPRDHNNHTPSSCASVYPLAVSPSLPSVQLPRPGIPFLQGIPCPPPCRVPAAASLPAGRPRGAGCLTVGSERRGQRAGGAIEWQCWLAALAACLAASLTGCQLAPHMPGPVSLPCVLGGRGARDMAGEWGPTGMVGCLGELLRVWLSPWSIRFLPPAPGRAGRQVLHRAWPGLGL